MMLNKALRLMRVFNDLSQKDLAEKLGISKSLISEIESGKKNSTIELLNKYSEFFDIPVSSIIFFSERLDHNTKTEKVRSLVSSKIIAMLEMIAKNSDRYCAEE
jgi:transcriptional regulator with XRE-family HTH domain